MALVSAAQMLQDAQTGGYAIGAFNVENMEMVQAVIEAAQRTQAPIILSTSTSTLKYASPAMFAAMVRTAAAEAGVSAALHLDHGVSFALCQACATAGYTSVMIDASQLPFEENVALSQEVAAYCKPLGIPVEAELGHVGGKEDDVHTEGDYGTDPQQAAAFVQQTGVDSLAVAIGTAHGFYKGEPKLNIPLLKEIRDSVPVPLVLHGASGLSDEAVQACIQAGICKINYATELRALYTGVTARILQDNPQTIDPKVFGREARKQITELVIEKIKLTGSAGMA